MVLGRRHWIVLTLALVLLILLTACERPLGSSDSETAEQAAEATAVAETAAGEEDVESAAQDEAESAAGSGEVGEPESSDEAAEEPESSEEAADEAETDDPDVGGGTPETAAEDATDEGEETDQASTGEDSSEEATTDEAESAMEDETAAEEATGDEAATASDDDTSGDEAEAADSDASEASDETMAAEEEAVADSPALPATHTVAAGENLYRIGLKYGLSWVVLARHNYLPNANYIRVGQVLQIPGGGQPEPDPAPAPPDETGHIDYVVKRGDTLNKIGQRYGVSWLEIAEANGLVNPNLIYAGQVLKIPTSEPDDPPSTTHTVERGETLYRISLQYGVHWLAIAQANSIAPPYVIYPGQVLTLPGG